MEPFIKISDFGAIHVLGIPFAAHVGIVKNHFKGYEIEENEKCVCVKKVSFSNLPNLDIIFDKNTENRITEVKILNYFLNKNECERIYGYFKEKLKSLNLFSEEKDSSITSAILSNHLHRVSLFKQNGCGNNENHFPFSMTINCRLMDVSDDKRNEAIRALYINEPNYNWKKAEGKVKLLVKSMIVLVILIIVYLFALNGRYSHAKDFMYFDKWTNKAVYFNHKTGYFDNIKPN